PSVDASPTDAPVIDGSVPDAAPDASPCTGTNACVPVAPSGWTGPYELYDGPGPAPACGAAYVATPFYTGNDQLVAPPATCTCSCGAPTGVTCSSVTLTAYRGLACSNPVCASATLSPFTCTPVDTASCGYPYEFSATASTAQGGSCAPASVSK